MKSSLFSAFVLLSLSAGTASADTLTSRVVTVNPTTHTIVLSDKSLVTYDPTTTKILGDVQPGSRVEVSFSGSEGDMSRILGITVLPD